jgi:dienelactone hydrolase
MFFVPGSLDICFFLHFFPSSVQFPCQFILMRLPWGTRFVHFFTTANLLIFYKRNPVTGYNDKYERFALICLCLGDEKSVKEPEILVRVDQLYHSGEYQQANELIADAFEECLEQRWLLYYWQVCLLARLGKATDAENTFQNALTQGYYYNEAVLHRDEDLASLQSRPRFESLVEQSQKLLQIAQAKAAPGLTLLEPVESNYPSVPLLIALHGNHSNSELMQPYWNHLSDQGWLVALPQSSRVSGNHLYSWDDPDLALRELSAHFATLSRKISVDPAHVVLAGFAKGGELAIRAALRQTLPATGFLCIAPFFTHLAEIEALISGAHFSSLRGYFILGEKDTHCTPPALRLVELMRLQGLPCQAEVIPGLGHRFPDDYRSSIQRGLQFLTQN